MKKYWALWLFLFVIGGFFFWLFLDDVEKYGKVHALLGGGYIFFWAIGSLLFLCLNVAYWGGIAKLIGKYLKNVSKYINYIVIAIYVILGIWLECKLVNGAELLEKQYKDYQFQLEFEHKHHINE